MIETNPASTGNLSLFHKFTVLQKICSFLSEQLLEYSGNSDASRARQLQFLADVLPNDFYIFTSVCVCVAFPSPAKAARP